MVTATEYRALMEVPCTWCGAMPKVECTTKRPRPGAERPGRRHRPTTLEGGAHEARWLLALGRPPGVVAVGV